HRATGLVRCWRRWVSGSARASGSSGCSIPSCVTRASTVRTEPRPSWDRTKNWTARTSSQAFAVRCATSSDPTDRTEAGGLEPPTSKVAWSTRATPKPSPNRHRDPRLEDVPDAELHLPPRCEILNLAQPREPQPVEDGAQRQVRLLGADPDDGL